MAGRTATGLVAAPGRPPARLRPVDALVAGALAVAAALLRAGPLGPSSLWLDDAWTALVVRADSLVEAFGLAVTAPGFGLLLRGWLAAVGFSETAAQLPAFAFAVLGPPAVFALGLRAGLSRTASVLGGALLLLAPAHLTFATRVKQYTLDALLAAVIIGLAWRVLAAPDRPRRWAGLVGGALAATVVSAAVAPVVATGFAAGLVAAWQRGCPLRPGLLATGAYGAAGLGWYIGFVRPSVSPALRQYWSGQYVDLTAGPAAAAGDLARNLGGMLSAFSALPPLAAGLALLAAAVVVAWRRPAATLLLAGPVAVAVLLAALRLAPLGGGRTDVYLFPGLALLAAVAVDACVPRNRRAGAVLVGAVGAVVAASLLAGAAPGAYPSHDVRPLIARMEAALAPGDAVLVYSGTRWAYGLYTRFPVRFPDDPTLGTGFDVAVVDPRVHVLAPQRDHPQRYAPDVAEGVAGATRVWLVASGWRGDLAVLEGIVAERGLTEVHREARPGGLLVRWEDTGG